MQKNTHSFQFSHVVELTGLNRNFYIQSRNYVSFVVGDEICILLN